MTKNLRPESKIHSLASFLPKRPKMTLFLDFKKGLFLFRSPEYRFEVFPFLESKVTKTTIGVTESIIQIVCRYYLHPVTVVPQSLSPV